LQISLNALWLNTQLILPKIQVRAEQLPVQEHIRKTQRFRLQQLQMLVMFLKTGQKTEMLYHRMQAILSLLQATEI